MPTHNVPHLSPQQINLVSSQGIALNSSGNKVRFQLRDAIILPNNVDLYVTLASFRYSNVFYNIGLHNNLFYYSISADIVDIEHVEIPVGNYNLTTLLETLQTLLVDHGFTFEYDELTFKITISNSLWGFILRGGTRSVHSYLGWVPDTAQDTTHTCANCINLGGISVLDICIPQLHLNSNGTRGSTVSVISTILNDVLTGQTRSYTNQTTDKYKASQSVLTTLDIEIYGDGSIDVDFLGTPWFISLYCSFVYRFEYIAPYDNQFT